MSSPPVKPAADRGLPLLGKGGGLPFAWRGESPIGREQFLSHVQALAARLPEHRYIINLCEDRYRFLVAYGAALVRGQTSLLPHNRVPAALQKIGAEYDGPPSIGDKEVEAAAGAPGAVPEVPVIGRDQMAAIVFTSGSTGQPKADSKRWGDLVEGALLVQGRYGVWPEADTVLVATVLPQHMFGLEASVMLPLVTGVTVHAGRPFFPEDLRRALATSPQHRILITTPYHIGVLLQAGLEYPRVDLIISATAPLNAQLAARAEQAFGARVMEIFGSTESGAIASRRTALEELWTPYDRLSLTSQGSQHFVEGPHLSQPVPLGDRLEKTADGRFRVLGRDEDIVKIGGKRGSLGDLNRALGEVPGVVDGVFILPEEESGAVTRIAALVVAPGQTAQGILQALSQRIDPAFLPRPLHLVERLPRNETGKTVRADLLRLLQRLGSGG